ncbi:stage V sporulation protein AD [Calidifontibacillus erzurumensis]|uniref:stage V sporulation protein AD n=1 Tax=Calidifontibacillus erzurumensis TaxID=2741433 RepID=UPI0035B5603A
MGQVGKQTWQFQNDIFVHSTGTAVGPIEAKGPLGHCFDIKYNDLHCGQKNWELAERQLMEDSINVCLEKVNLKYEDIDIFLAGDLLNQNVIANYVARGNQIPFLCMFSACSTSMETLAVGASLIEGGFASKVLAAVSSHNATAERQFRSPTEYGGQKPPTANFTVTGAGAILIGKDKNSVKITAATIGRVVDYGISNPYDMGSAMAPAAADTIINHFRDLKRTPKDYDLILTGDLSSVGAPILRKMLSDEGFPVHSNYNDCGLMVYHSDQNVFAGGSGCACSAVVTYGHIIDLIKAGALKRVLVVATGALLSPMMIQQKETIPTIAHGVVFERVE